MTSLQQAIQKNFYDKASGNYFVTVDSAKREIHEGYLRKYSYLWSICAHYQAAMKWKSWTPDQIYSSIGKPVLSYNTGTMLEANVYLYEITGDKKYHGGMLEILARYAWLETTLL